MNNNLWLKEPLVFLNSVSVIASYFDAVKAGSQVKVFILRPSRQEAHKALLENPGTSLPFIGQVSAKPELALALLPPTAGKQKTDEKKPMESSASSGAGASSASSEDQPEPEDVYKQAMNLLMEDAEAFEAEAGCGDDDGQLDQSDEILAERALRQVLLQATSHAIDDLELQKSDLEAEANELLMEKTVHDNEWHRAKQAVITGACAAPTESEIQSFRTGNTLDDDDAVMEAFLNLKGLGWLGVDWTASLKLLNRFCECKLSNS